LQSPVALMDEVLICFTVAAAFLHGACALAGANCAGQLVVQTAFGIEVSYSWSPLFPQCLIHDKRQCFDT
jgi:hypothetical protein